MTDRMEEARAKIIAVMNDYPDVRVLFSLAVIGEEMDRTHGGITAENSMEVLTLAVSALQIVAINMEMRDQASAAVWFMACAAKIMGVGGLTEGEKNVYHVPAGRAN